jgi:hypothetical protein
MRKYYIEFWSTDDATKATTAATFTHINIKAFIKKVLAAGKYVVHLELVEPYRKVLFSTRQVNHQS